MPSLLAELALQANEIVTVCYQDDHSVGSDSFIDLNIGYVHEIVSSNQPRLNDIPEGGIAIVRCNSKKLGRHAVIGIIGPHIANYELWRNFKYTRKFTPITKVFAIDEVKEKWDAICQVHEVESHKFGIFANSFGYNRHFLPAIRDALRIGVFPSRSPEILFA